MLIAILNVLKWILIIIAILLAAVILIAAAILWSTVTVDIAANKRKAIMNISLWRFIRKEFEIPLDKPGDIEPKSFDYESEKSEKSEQDLEEQDDEQKSGVKDFFEIVDREELKSDLKSLWNSEYYFFDFEALHDVIIKYAEIIFDCKYGLGRLFGHMRYKIRLDRLDIYIRYGSGEPDKTGIAYGAMYAGVGSLTPLIKKYIKTDGGPRLFLDPNYVSKMFDYEVGALIKTRLAHIINAIIVGVVSYKLRKRKRKSV